MYACSDWPDAAARTFRVAMVVSETSRTWSVAMQAFYFRRKQIASRRRCQRPAVLTAVWWGAVAVNAPWALRLPPDDGGGVVPYLGKGGAWNLPLACTALLMAVSAAGGLLGAARIAGVWSTSRRAA